jgi:NAD+ kinase
MAPLRIACVHSGSPRAEQGFRTLTERYDFVAPEECDVLVVLGGDGFMLHCLHEFMDSGRPIYGMNCGTVGFLMNNYASEDLPGRIEDAQRIGLRPLRMRAELENGEIVEALAVNEVALTRDSAQAAKIRITVNGQVRLDQLIADGVLVSTAAGSTAYNLSAHGPIIPMGANLLALTPISAFRPRRWRGALLSDAASIGFEVLEREKRPVLAVADSREIRHPVRVEVMEDSERRLTLLYDAEHNLEERILNEQFLA